MARVGIVGASDKVDRYSHRAQLCLAEAGHTLYLISPQYDQILGLPCYPDLAAVVQAGLRPEIVTLYVNPQRLRSQVADLIALAPQLVIANPGSEDAAISSELSAAGIRVLLACTLVLVATGAFARLLD